MRHARQAFSLVVLMTLAIAGSRPLAAQPVPLGPETEVDTDWGYDYRTCPLVAVAPDHSFEIAWTAGTNATTDVRVRHYGANGLPTDPDEVGVSPEIDIEDQYVSRYVLALDPVSTGFRVVYAYFDDTSSHFFRRKLGPAGAPAPGPSRPLGTRETQWIFRGPGDTLFSSNYDPSRRSLRVWKVDSLGKPSGPAYVLNSRPIDLGYVAIEPLSDGGWIAAYSGATVATPGHPARQVIRARRFNAAGVPQGPDFDVNTAAGGPPERQPFLARYGILPALGPGGRFAVAWTNNQTIRVRLFDGASRPLGPEILVARDRALQRFDSIAFNDAGQLLVLWGSYSGVNPTFEKDDLVAQVLNPDGILSGRQFRLSSSASDDYPAPFCGQAAWAGNAWVITWKALYIESGSAIYVRRFR